MSYLIVVAHPDDEVLGVGATIYKIAQSGNKVNVCILCSNAEARNLRPSVMELQRDIQESAGLLGVHKVICGSFPNIQFNTIPHLELVQFIEKAIVQTGADVIFTHHPSDLNNDHVQTSLACQAAVRIFQRRKDINPLKDFLFMEIPSATEWALNSSVNAFRPNTFIEIGEQYLIKKIEALSIYKGVMRDYPHPRSQEALRGLAAFRGAQCGLEYAEAFESVFRRIDKEWL